MRGQNLVGGSVTAMVKFPPEIQHNGPEVSISSVSFLDPSNEQSANETDGGTNNGSHEGYGGVIFQGIIGVFVGLLLCLPPIIFCELLNEFGTWPSVRGIFRKPNVSDQAMACEKRR